MRKFMFRIVVVVVAAFSLPWALISSTFRELRRAALFIWLEMKSEWWSIQKAWKKGSFK